VVLIASSRHFAHVAVAGMPRTRYPLHRIATTPGIAARGRCNFDRCGRRVGLLLRRGLFPGGSGDYYTHYFYYYLKS